MRYKFYREHKYVSFALNDLERRIAKADFSNVAERDAIRTEFENVVQLLQGHASYEDERLHALLKNKNSTVFAHAEEDHVHMEETLRTLQELFNNISRAPTAEAQIEAGYQFYLVYRKFVGENLLHLHEEETQILPELQRLYSDDELRAVEFHTYNVMTEDEMVEMIAVLFPHMNPSDKAAILKDIADVEPAKYAAILPRIQTFITS